jgi:hypothetical protein
MIKPTFHHVNLKTTRMQEMIDLTLTLDLAESKSNDQARPRQ